MDFVRTFTILLLLAVAVVGVAQGARVLARREAELAPGVPVRGRPAGLLGLIYLGGGLAAGAAAVLWLVGGAGS
jgi:hypothetical protein